MTTPSPIRVRGIAVWCVVSLWMGYATNVQDVSFVVRSKLLANSYTFDSILAFPYSFPIASLNARSGTDKTDYVRNITDTNAFGSLLCIHREDLDTIRQKLLIQALFSAEHKCIGTMTTLECISSFLKDDLVMISVVSTAVVTNGRLVSERFEKHHENAYGQDVSSAISVLTGILRISNYSTVYNQLLQMHRNILDGCKAETLDTTFSAYLGDDAMHLSCTVKTLCPLILSVGFTVNGGVVSQADNRAQPARSGEDHTQSLNDRAFVAYATQQIPKSGHEPIRLDCYVESNIGWKVEYWFSFNRSAVVGDSAKQNIMRPTSMRVSQIATRSYHISRRSKHFDSRAVIVGIIAGLLFILTVLALIYMQRKSPMPCVCV
ncbi:m146 [Muromegalovirus G4]|uniref:M146 n=1 Tax=Muromegalovirus G4 TaxID=524650 RepID=B3UX91_MUHV1|nr:m146 [Muromegalovirus G4]QNL29290.1 m146 [Muromegalovirus G4]